MKELKLARIDKLTRKELRRGIEDCFEYAPEASSVDRLAILQEAQFYTTELDRRHDSWISIRDLVLELVVIALIGTEIYLAIKQGRDEGAFRDKQNVILSNLETSTQATADQLKEQLAIEYRVFINPQPTGATGIMLFNNSKSEIVLWGLKIGRNQPIIHPRGPSTIAEHTTELISFSSYYPKLAISGVVPFDLYLKNAAGQEFVWSGRIDSNNPTAGHVGEVPDGALRAEQWSGKITLSSVPSVNP